MFRKRSLWAFLSVVAILAIALSITPVRAWASSLLGLFRVQRVTVINFDPEAVNQAGNSLSDSQEIIELLFDKNLQIIEQGDVQAVETAEAAAQAAGFTPRLPVRNDPDDQAQLFVKPGLQANFTIDQPTLQALADTAGIDLQIPEAMNGEVVTLEVPTAVGAVFGGCPVKNSQDRLPAGCTILFQVPSPTVTAPDGLNVTQLGEALLQFLGYSAEEARSLSAKIDWTSTLVLPIPAGEGITSVDVTADGVPATFLKDENEAEYLLVWVKDGVMYGLQGEGSLDDAQSLVATLQ